MTSPQPSGRTGAMVRLLKYVIIMLSPLILVALVRPLTDHGFIFTVGKNLALVGITILAMQFVLSASVSSFRGPMKPLVNLKSFLAALLIMIVSGSLLVAYFRNYSPGADGHGHGDSHAAAGLSAISKPHAETSPSPAPPSQKEGDHAVEPAHRHQQ